MRLMKRITRRDMLRGAGGSAALASLSFFIPRLEAAEGPPPLRYMYWYEAVMPEKSLVTPLYGGPMFGGEWAPLNEMKDKLLLMRGLPNKMGNPDSNAGPHPRPGAAAWTGSPLRNSETPAVFRNSKRGSAGFGRGVSSIDQWLGERLKGATPFTDLRAGMENEGKEGPLDTTISIKDGDIVARHQSPLSMFNELFADFKPPMGGEPAPSMPSDTLRQRKSLIDFVASDVQRLQNRVSNFDARKIEQHLVSIRETETQLSSLAGFTPGAGCAAPETPAEGGASPEAYKAYNSIMTNALACNLTQVAGAHYGSHANKIKYSWLPGGSKGFHGATHDGGTANYIKAVLGFRAEMWLDLLKKLDAVQEENGKTLLDNTIIYWTTDVCYNHDRSDMMALIGGGGGHFNMGQSVRINNSLQDVLTSIAHAFGFEDVATFGPKEFGAGPLPSSVFKG